MAENEADLIKIALMDAGAVDILKEAVRYRRILSKAYKALEGRVDLDNKESAKLFVEAAIAQYPDMIPVFRQEKKLLGRSLIGLIDTL